MQRSSTCVPIMVVTTASLFCQVHSSQSADRSPSAKVSLIAFDTRGNPLGPPIVRTFESYEHKNYASKFHLGVAEGIPFGVYRVEAYRTAYSSEERYARVYEREVTVVLGLTVGYELPSVPLTLHGKVVGLSPARRARSFVKLSGIYSNLSMESAIRPDGGFDLGGLTWGSFLLLVIDDQGVLATRSLSVPYSGPPLEIRVGG